MKHIVLIILAALAVGCSSGGPTVSGIGVFSTRSVRIDETVTVRLPVDPEKGDGWRLIQFDSSILRPMPGSGAVEGSRITFQFRAATPGEAELVFRRVKNGRAVDEDRRYKVIVRGSM